MRKRAALVSRYSVIIETIFHRTFAPGNRRVRFDRSQFNAVARDLNFPAISNVGDIVYSFRYRTPIPPSIQAKAPQGYSWIILGAGDAAYEFRLAIPGKIAPAPNRTEIKIPDATPEIFKRYAPGMDEQALLTKIRYNRILDIFTGMACYSIQNHYRTKVPSIGQIEIDEVYVGVSKNGAHYVMPCQAKSPGDSFGAAQVYQDLALCHTQYPHAICRPIGMQFKSEDSLAIIHIQLEEVDEIFYMTVSDEKHYRLVSSNGVQATDLAQYRADDNHV